MGRWGLKILCVYFMLVSNSEMSCSGREGPQVPCYFIFGDSLVDNGNNNNLPFTLAKVNFLPYGIDFPAGPTGRFTNGRTIFDIIAERLGLETYPPPFATARGQEILQGVNYASAAAGIRDESGLNYGDRITMNKQVRNYQASVQQIAELLGNETVAINYLSKCIFTVGMGSNDYINNYLMPNIYPASRLYPPHQYAALLADQYSLQLQTLYRYGARKVALFGLAPIGCIPGELKRFGATPGSRCVEDINVKVQMFNERLKLLVDDLNRKFSDARFTYINIFNMSYADASAFGVRVIDSPCCGGLNGCYRTTIPCRNRSDYVYWDEAHPTDIVNVYLGGRAYKSATPSDAHPIDIHALAHLSFS